MPGTTRNACIILLMNPSPTSEKARMSQRVDERSIALVVA